MEPGRALQALYVKWGFRGHLNLEGGLGTIVGARGNRQGEKA